MAGLTAVAVAEKAPTLHYMIDELGELVTECRHLVAEIHGSEIENEKSLPAGIGAQVSSTIGDLTDLRKRLQEVVAHAGGRL